MKHINPNTTSANQNILREENIHELISNIIKGDRFALAKGITLIESEKEDDIALSLAVLEGVKTNASSSRIAVTGAPGVGKSTFIEVLGNKLIEKGQKLAVLAVDPSSSISKGSILGDKTRMEELGRNEQAFIRPSSAGKTLGGVAAKTRESIFLCEASGYSTVVVETVGVGQSETLVNQMTDLSILLLSPGAGDELQGIKRGIVELADIVIIHKADLEDKALTLQTKKDYRNALHILKQAKSFWEVPVLEVSSLEKTGFEKLISQIDDFFKKSNEANHLGNNRSEQDLFWYENHKQQLLELAFLNSTELEKLNSVLKNKIQEGEASALAAAYQFVLKIKEKNS